MLEDGLGAERGKIWQKIEHIKIAQILEGIHPFFRIRPKDGII
jgi:hypothetical protein